MRYLYKINSQYDGFKPARIPERLIEGRFLRLGWHKYLDTIRYGDEVWIVFVGRGFENGVYVQGLVAAIDADEGYVQLRVRRHSVAAPLTDPNTSAELRAAVDVRYRQVFLWPADRQLQETCHARECGERRCLACDVWNGIPQLDPAHYLQPAPLRGETVVPAYWLIPTRCYLYYGNRRPTPWIRLITDMFASFKVGEERYAFPFAAGIRAALDARGEGAFDAIVPIPLSPEKAEAGELDRCKVLATELSRLNGAPVRNYLTLSRPISKRRMQAQGYRPAQFIARYREYLDVNPRIRRTNRILLLDDAITRGSTISAALAEIRLANPNIDVVVAAAGQMILTAVVADENGPAW